MVVLEKHAGSNERRERGRDFRVDQIGPHPVPNHHDNVLGLAAVGRAGSEHKRKQRGDEGEKAAMHGGKNGMAPAGIREGIRDISMTQSGLPLVDGCPARASIAAR